MPPTVGQALREARTMRGMELSEVERVTKIRLKYLSAIEEDRWDLLPGEAYARGFLSTYAEFLGLDERALLAEFRVEHEAPVEEPLPETMLPKPGVTSRRLPWRSLLLGVAVIAVAALVVGLVLTGGSDGGNQAAPSHQRSGQGSGRGASTTAEKPADHPNRLSLRLAATGTVWVCLTDHHGRPLIDGETLTAGEERGPFDGHSFELALGNGAVELSVDGESVDVPSSSDPLGYRIGQGGTDELGESARPDCL